MSHTEGVPIMAATATATKTRRETSMRRGPQPFSTLKEEATVKPATSDTSDQPAEQLTKTVAQIQAELKAARELLAQARQTEKEARLAAKAARVTKADPRTKLERVITRQANEGGGTYCPAYLYHRVRDRVAAGQPKDEAYEAVFAQYRQIIEDQFAAAQQANAD